MKSRLLVGALLVTVAAVAAFALGLFAFGAEPAAAQIPDWVCDLISTRSGMVPPPCAD